MKKSKVVAPEPDSYDDMDDDEKRFLAEELLDADIASTMGSMMIYHPKMEESVMKAAGHPGAAAALAVQTLLGVREKLIEKDLPFSERIWAAENGVLRDLIDNIAQASAHNGQPMDEEIREQAFAKGVEMLQMYDEAGSESANKPKEAPPQGGAAGAPQPAAPMSAAGMAVKGGGY